MIVHYMQPHFPSIPNPTLTEGKETESFGSQDQEDIWWKLRKDDINHQTVLDAYRENLEYVLDDIQLLLNNVDRDEVVITSDHGNAFGERYLFGHPPHMPVDCLREVPWVETDATDSGEYTPSTEPSDDDQIAIEDQLSALGYA
jgi:membrane-anchored protein YejM (alkaline phosphatase superfamily)